MMRYAPTIRPSRHATSCLAILLLVVGFQSRAQTLEWSAQSRGGAGVAQFRAIRYDRADNLTQIGPDGSAYFAAIYTDRKAGQPQLIKLAANGDVVWKKEHLPRLDGIYEISGLRYVSPGRLVISIPASDSSPGATTLVVAYDSNTGDAIWQTELSGGVDAIAPSTSITSSADGDVVVALIHSNTNNAGSTCRLTRLDSATGQTVWARDLSVSGFVCPGIQSVAIDNDRVVWATDQADSSGGIAVGLSRLDNGAEIWSTGLPSVDTTSPVIRLLVDAETNVVVAASGNGVGTSRVFKLAANGGAVLWNRPFITTVNQADRIRHAVLDAAGNLFALGHSGAAPQISELVLTKFDRLNGSVLWAKRKGAPMNSRFYPSLLVLDGAGSVFAGSILEGLFPRYSEFQATKFSAQSGAELFSTRWGDSPQTTMSLYTLGMSAEGRIVMAGFARPISQSPDSEGALAIAIINANGGLQSARVVNVQQEGMDDSFACDGNRAGQGHRVLDSTGAVIVSGCRWAGTADRAMFAKWSAAGNRVWDVDFAFFPYGDSAVSRFVLTEQGDVIAIVKNTQEEGQSGVLRISGEDGSLLWNWIPPFGDGVDVRGLVVDPIFGVVVAGTRSDAVSFNRHPFVARLAPGTGALMWSRPIENGTSPYFNIQSMKGDGQGAAYLVVQVGTSDSSPLGRMIKLRVSDGAQLWAVDHPVEEFLGGNLETLDVLPDLGVLALGLRDAPQSSGCRVTRYSAAGETIWRRDMPANLNYNCNRLAVRAGHDHAFYTTHAVNAGFQEGCLIEKRAVASGNVEWSNFLSYVASPSFSPCRSVDTADGGLRVATWRAESIPAPIFVHLSQLNGDTGALVSELETSLLSDDRSPPLELLANGNRVTVLFSGKSEEGFRAQAATINLDGIFLDGFLDGLSAISN